MIASCSVDYTLEELSESIPSEIPEFSLFSYTHAIFQNDRLYVEFQGEAAHHYTDKNLIVLRKAAFKEFDGTGKVVTEGESGFIRYYTDSENAELFGGFSLYTFRESARIEGEYLFWNHKTKILTGKENTYVTLTKDDGSVITGQDFRGDTNTMTFSFGRNAEGTYTYEEK